MGVGKYEKRLRKNWVKDQGCCKTRESKWILKDDKSMIWDILRRLLD